MKKKGLFYHYYNAQFSPQQRQTLQMQKPVKRLKIANGNAKTIKVKKVPAKSQQTKPQVRIADKRLDKSKEAKNTKKSSQKNIKEETSQ